MANTIYDPILAEAGVERRKQAQEDFGRHLVEQRNRMAALVRKWIETDAKFPVPIYDRLIDRVRRMDKSLREDMASLCLLMADQVVEAILCTFDCGDEARAGDTVVNYAIIAQFRAPGTDDIREQFDVNRGEPVIAVWNRYKRWLNRYAPSDLRTRLTSDDNSQVEPEFDQ